MPHLPFGVRRDRVGGFGSHTPGSARDSVAFTVRSIWSCLMNSSKSETITTDRKNAVSCQLCITSFYIIVVERGEAGSSRDVDGTSGMGSFVYAGSGRDATQTKAAVTQSTTRAGSARGSSAPSTR